MLWLFPPSFVNFLLLSEFMKATPIWKMIVMPHRKFFTPLAGLLESMILSFIFSVTMLMQGLQLLSPALEAHSYVSRMLSQVCGLV